LGIALLSLAAIAEKHRREIPTKPHLQLKSRLTQDNEHPSLTSEYSSIYYEDSKSLSIKLEGVYEHEFKRPRHSSFLAGDLSYAQLNNYNYYYVGSLRMGIFREYIPVLWDTGSAWLAIEGY
jgi:hypothetical protein